MLERDLLFFYLQEKSRVVQDRMWLQLKSGFSLKLFSPSSRGTPGVTRRQAVGTSRSGSAWGGYGEGGCPGSAWEWSARKEEESVSSVKASSS